MGGSWFRIYFQTGVLSAADVASQCSWLLFQFHLNLIFLIQSIQALSLTHNDSLTHHLRKQLKPISNLNYKQNKMSELEVSHHLGPLEVTGKEQEDENYQSVLDKIEAPPTNFNLKQNALEYDIKLGWLPRSQITGPIPLSFTHYLSDSLFQSKAKSFMYLGYRACHSFQVHERYYQKGKNYPFYQFHLCKSQFLERFFKKYYSQYEFGGSRQAVSLGSSPLEFDSDFEGGNLDGVYYEEEEYRLLLRVDSNTQGHCSYYNFRVRVNEAGKYAFRIMNINKQKSLYQRGMSPYVRYLKDGKWSQFRQCDSKVRFGDSALCEQFDLKVKLKSLYFEFQFTYEVDEYEFSYTIPYTYSSLVQFLNSLRNSPFLHFTKLSHSLSGVEIPLLSIGSPDRGGEEEQTREPHVVVITGRVHPSEANGSHIVNGVIKTLLGNSESAKALRKNVVFKIIPMLNPDGVIMGNTRTSFSGKDLNRRYSKSTQFVFPEIIGVMDYVGKLKSKYGNRLLFIIDIHGHSARKNSFFYGPEYSIIDLQYMRCRLLPRIYSQKTDIFRYYSCKYKLASSKENTARGYFNSNGIRAYTHETSNHCFWNFASRKDEPFSRTTLEKLGADLVDSISEYVKQQPAPSKYARLELHSKELQPEPEHPPMRQRGTEDDEEESSNSDQMDSSRDDSEDESDDFQEKKLQQFYNRINQNREYFIEELQALEKATSDPKEKDKSKEDKKRKKTETQAKAELQQEPHLKMFQKREKMEEEIMAKKAIEKVDWAAKAAYPEKKKIYQEQVRMSSVIFGSSIPSTFFVSNEPVPATSSQLSTFNTTKYSIKCLEAQFKSNPVKYPSPEPKVYHSKQLTREISLREAQTSKEFARQEVERHERLEKLKAQRFKQLKQQSQAEAEVASNPKPISKSEMERLLSRPSQYCILKPLPVCSVDLQVERQQEERIIKSLNSSLKVLTRKKSIKSIRDSQSPPRRNNNSFKGISLGNRLPSLNTFLNRF